MINKKHLSPIFLVLSLTFLGLGCVKKDAESKIAQVLLVPLSPNATTVDFSINGTLYATTVGYSTTTGTVRYTLPYYTIEPKSPSTIAYNATGTNNAFASVSKDLLEDQVYSTFLIIAHPFPLSPLHLTKLIFSKLALQKSCTAASTSGI